MDASALGELESGLGRFFCGGGMWVKGSQARVGAIQLWELIWDHSQS